MLLSCSATTCLSPYSSRFHSTSTERNNSCPLGSVSVRREQSRRAPSALNIWAQFFSETQQVKPVYQLIYFLLPGSKRLWNKQTPNTNKRELFSLKKWATLQFAELFMFVLWYDRCLIFQCFMPCLKCQILDRLSQSLQSSYLTFWGTIQTFQKKKKKVFEGPWGIRNFFTRRETSFLWDLTGLCLKSVTLWIIKPFTD